MNVMCFGGSLDGKYCDVDLDGRVFSVPIHKYGVYEKEDYYLYRGRFGDGNWSNGEWWFAVVSGTEPTDEMAAKSRPLLAHEREAKEEQARKATAREKRHREWQAAKDFYNAVEGASKASREF